MTDERIKRYQTAIQAYNVQMYVLSERFKTGEINEVKFRKRSDDIYGRLDTMIERLRNGERDDV